MLLIVARTTRTGLRDAANVCTGTFLTKLAPWGIAVVGLVGLCLVTTQGCRGEPEHAFPWTEPRPQRLIVSLNGVGWAAGRIPIVLTLDAGPPNPDTLRVSELDVDGTVIDAAAPFQYDRDLSPNGAGWELTLLLGGDATRSDERLYAIYFASAPKTPEGAGAASRAYEPVEVGPRVEAREGIQHEGQESIRVRNAVATWYFHLHGAGFASIVDREGHDWLGYHPGGGARGEYRGIPNMVYPEGYFHPGGSDCVTRVDSTGPLRVVLTSECGGGAWATRWEIFRRFARLTVLRSAGPYWFLYEGTPGGELDEEHDYYALSNGRRYSAGARRDDDLPEPEWLYFGSAGLPRVLWLAHDADDDHPDAYYPMEGAMTVFGFGRQRLRAFLTGAPRRFAVGLAETTDHARVAGIIETILARPEVRVSQIQTAPPAP